MFKFEEMGSDKMISTSLVECERVKAKIGKALRADGSPCVWKKFPPARGQNMDERVSSPKHFRWAPICTTIWYWSSYRRGKLSCRGKLPTRIFVLLQPFPCREIMIIDLFLVALLSLVCLVLTDSSSLVTRLTEKCHRSDGE